MQRRIVILLVSLSIVATVLAAAYVVTKAPAVQLARSPNEADHVTLYENGLAAIELHRTFNATGSDTTLELPLPPTAVFDSLTLAGDGVTVKEIRSALAQTSGIHAGDTVTVHVDQASYHGLVQAIDGDQLALATEKGLTYVSMSKASAIEVETTATQQPSAPGSLDATIVVEAQPGEHDIIVSYLAQGPGWTPSYRLDEDSGQMTYFATMTGLDDWSGITLDLVSGTPNVVYTPTHGPMFAADGRAVPMAAATSVSFDTAVGPSAPMGELHRYHYGGALDVARGESVRLVLAQGKVAILRHYLDVETSAGGCCNVGDKQDLPVLEKLRIRNDVGEPLAAGTVRVYKDGEWVGEDSMQNVARGDETNVTVASSDEVTAKLVLTAHDALPGSDRWTYALTLASHKPTSSDVRAAIEAPSYRTTVQQYSPGGELVGTRVTWDSTTLDAGQSATFSLSYETQKY